MSSTWRPSAFESSASGRANCYGGSSRAKPSKSRRGRRVAILAPPPDGTALDRLRAMGEVEPAKGDLDDLPDPLVPGPGVERSSDVLKRLRAGER